MKNKIKDVIKEKGITQKELGLLIGMSEAGLSNAINGSATKVTLQKVANALDVDYSELVDDSNNVKFKGVLDLNGIKIPCYVLKSGIRVLSGRGMQDALRMVDNEDGKPTAGTRLARYFAQKTLNPFISKYIDLDHFNPLVCMDGRSVIHGYKAEVLADICDAFMEARACISLSPRQAIIANQCELLMRAFARVGIIALVDEATGYDKEKGRAKNELQKFLATFINQEASKWIKTFNDQFFEDIYKMRNWTWAQTTARPGFVGKIINDIVYERLAPLVYNEINRLNPKNENGNRRFKNHQFLTSDIGRPALERHLAIIHSFAVASDYNWPRFMYLLDKAFPKQYQQLALFDEFELL